VVALLTAAAPGNPECPADRPAYARLAPHVLAPPRWPTTIPPAADSLSGCPPERARFYTQAVLSTLAGFQPEVASVLARRLPDGEELFSRLTRGLRHAVPGCRSG
jgi:hypothetical protein